jgi:hypothetical protein
MLSKSPKNTEKVYWTGHAKYKMQYYGLSAQKILGVIRRPKREEDGIVKNTIAVMQPISPKIIINKEVWKQEVWAMYQLRYRGAISNFQIPISKKIRNSKFEIKNLANRQIRIISAWRYPGVSPKKNPIPDDIIREIGDIL